ncbi:putative ABC transporter phosphite binding protein PhnD1 [Sinobacterium norvegicum]|uniref:ABC transporter phosphite binding protein PhnD1 n=1 Tax=Sinobacterium norvegicum TaxID=1641715 RepID=A0ABN8ENZ7_9GAMM|nr:putative selenate ABC transporter substrate-binding protein [Sinobacterium norvegicum]CAH0992970.1 putative ABC transporter phosphite binding protein PhnD1 [Sinobacterium norvegicum]
MNKTFGFAQAALLRAFIAAVALCSLLASAAHAEAPGFTFTAIPDQDESQLRQRFAIVADHLSKELGVKVEYIPVKSYAAAVTAFRNNQVQLAWFGGLSGVRARGLVNNSQAIAQGAEDPEFKSYIIANRSTGLAAKPAFPSDTGELSFTFGSKGSTSGRLMPEYYIRKNTGLAPDKAFARVGFSGDHSRTIALVEAGSFDLGAVNYKVWDKAVAEGRVDTEKVTVIWTTPSYPDYHWTIRGDVDSQYGEGFSQRLQQVLIDIKQPVILEAFPRSGFIEADNNDFAPIESVARELGLMR